MIEEVQSLLDRYWVWLQGKSGLRQLDGSVEITTPYLDRHNDYFQIYATQDSDGFLLTDDGYVLADLEMSGLEIEKARQHPAFQAALGGLGVEVNDENALQVRTSPADFALRTHSLVQAMLAVNNLGCLVTPAVPSKQRLFRKDVAAWLDDSGIRYSPKRKFDGKSGFQHEFDFVIPRSERQPVRLLQVAAAADRRTVEKMAFALPDVQAVLPSEPQAYAILNDREKAVSEKISGAVAGYGWKSVLWSRRTDFHQELAA